MMTPGEYRRYKFLAWMDAHKWIMVAFVVGLVAGCFLVSIDQQLSGLVCK